MSPITLEKSKNIIYPQTLSCFFKPVASGGKSGSIHFYEQTKIDLPASFFFWISIFLFPFFFLIIILSQDKEKVGSGEFRMQNSSLRKEVMLDALNAATQLALNY